ncbi:MAG: hypothetical protein QXK77_03350 [Archaeoglobaceae archaeon]
MDFLRLEYDIQHHLVLSRKNCYDHALIRLILSTLAEPVEIANLSKKDFKSKKGIFMVYLSGGKSRVSPVDEETFRMIEAIDKEKPFELEERDMDKIISKYSPKDRKYTARSLRKAMIRFLKDASLFDLEFEKLSLEKLRDFMEDFNPLYSGSWLDEEGLREFVLNYSVVNKVVDPFKISEETGLDQTFVSEVIRTGKSLFSYVGKFEAKNLSFEE